MTGNPAGGRLLLLCAAWCLGDWKGMLPGAWEVEKGALSFSMWLSQGQGWGIWGRAESVEYKPLRGNTDVPPWLARTRISRFPWALPCFQSWGSAVSLGLLSSILCWPRVEKTEQEAAQCGCLSSQEKRGWGRSVGIDR